MTGLGALTPVGLDAPSTWRALVAGAVGDRPDHPFRRLRAGDADRRRGQRLRPGRDARRQARPPHARASRSWRSPRRARRSPTPGSTSSAVADRVGVAIGSAVAGTPETERNVRALVEEGPRAVSPFYVASTILNMAACEVAIDLGAHGPVTASALACATGTYSLLEARRLILAGEADVVIAGGGDAGINEAVFAGLSNMGPLSEQQRRPDRRQPPLRLRPRRLRLRRGRGGDGGRVGRARRGPRRRPPTAASPAAPSPPTPST